MISAFLLPALAFFPAQETSIEPVARVVDEGRVSIYGVGDLVGADELKELRDAVVRQDLPQTVRIVALDEYAERLAAGTVDRATESLCKSIRTFVEPRATSKFRVTVSGLGELAVAGTAAQHEWVRGFLQSMRGFEGFIDIEIKMFKVPQGHLDRLVGGRTGVVLDAAALAALLRELDGLEGVDVLTAPRVVVHAGARANITTEEQTAYIKDYELTVLPDLDQEIVDPVVDVLKTGISYDVLAVPLGADRLAVKVDFAYSTAKRPFPSRTLPVGASGHEVTIQLPEVTTTRASARFDLGLAGAVVLSAVDPAVPEDGEESKDVVVLMQAKRVDALTEFPSAAPTDPAGPGVRRDGK